MYIYVCVLCVFVVCLCGCKDVGCFHVFTFDLALLSYMNLTLQCIFLASWLLFFVYLCSFRLAQVVGWFLFDSIWFDFDGYC